MVMQLAYALTFPDKMSAATYESAMVRGFDLGRTETVRVCTSETKAFVESMLDDRVGKDVKRERFAEALKGHGRDMRAAGTGQGFDRHLFGESSLSKR